MKDTVLGGQRRETLSHLMNYRRSRERLNDRALDQAERETLALWVRAISRVHATYARTDVEKAHVMERLFGFNHPVPRNAHKRLRVIKLAVDCCVSEPTIYKWREELVTATMLAAAEAGVLKPFGLGD